MTRDLRRLRDDNNVKAVVLRVNSPGGSAYASEQIWREVVRLKEKKPVIVSMGDYAASGGYYISCAADSIFADPTTLTGSIGIFGMIPSGEKLFKDKLGLDFDVVKLIKWPIWEPVSVHSQRVRSTTPNRKHFKIISTTGISYS